MDKEFLLDRCVCELVDESQRLVNRQGFRTASLTFRRVTLNGVLLRGHDAGATITEITRQLSEITTYESTWTQLQ